MDHRLAQQLIDQSMDLPLNTGDALELKEHLDACPDCRAYQQRFQSLEERLRRELPEAIRVPAFSPIPLAANPHTVEPRRPRAAHPAQLPRTVFGLAGLAVMFFLLWFAITRLVPGGVAPLPAGPVPGLASATPSPTATSQAVSRTPAPADGTLEYASPNLGVRLRYPSGWKADGADRFVGADGFVVLKMESSPQNMPLAQYCEQAAADAATRIGVKPSIEINEYDGLPACALLTPLSRSQNNESSLIVALPGSGVPVIYFTFRTDPGHFESIGQTLQLPTGLPRPERATPTPEPVATLKPGVTPAPIPAQVQQLGTLTLEEYPVVSEKIDTPIHFEFRDRLPAAVQAKRAAWRKAGPEARLGETNVALAPFGYALRKGDSRATLNVNGKSVPLGEHYELLQGENVILRVSMFFLASSIAPSNGNPGDFALQVEEAGSQGKTYLVRPGSIEEWDPQSHHYTPPVLWQGKLLPLKRSDNPGRIDLLAGNEIIYTHYLKSPSIDEPVKGLWAWEGHWVLEIAGEVIIDGQSLNRQKGYSEAFGWQILDGKPFYFFVKEGKTGIWYGDAPLPVQFDEVVHYRCCEPAMFNNTGNSRMAWFYARRSGLWEYVEIGKYSE